MKETFNSQKGEDGEGQTANPSEDIIQPLVLHAHMSCHDIERHMVNGHGNYRDDFQCTAAETLEIGKIMVHLRFLFLHNRLTAVLIPASSARFEETTLFDSRVSPSFLLMTTA